MDIDELLTHIQKLKVDLDFGKKETYSSPSRVFYYVHVLSDQPLTRTMTQWWLPDRIWPTYKENVCVIIHGHTFEEVCAAPHFCHVYGYQPKSTDNPNFRSLFNEKWKDLYNDQR